MSKADTKVKIKPNLALQEPPLWKIIYLNDDVKTDEKIAKNFIRSNKRVFGSSASSSTLLLKSSQLSSRSINRVLVVSSIR